MTSINKDVQLQYEGYLNTAQLWKNEDILGLKQIKLAKKPTHQINLSLAKKLRLGKYVERFVVEELKQQQNLVVLAENIQIQNNKITVGEIDCLLNLNNTAIHLEIIYKFYLYKKSNTNNEIDHWIGPNKNDSLRKKLIKLKEKQLPLLYNIHTKPLIKKLNLERKTIEQNVLFKAQLFTPYKENVDFNLINKKCLKGFYIHVSLLEMFSDCKFYIPHKINWLRQPIACVTWLSFTDFKTSVTTITNNKSAPLCWIKYPNGTLNKFFVIWW